MESCCVDTSRPFGEQSRAEIGTQGADTTVIYGLGADISLAVGLLPQAPPEGGLVVSPEKPLQYPCAEEAASVSQDEFT